jgi:hypothetical protein
VESRSFAKASWPIPDVMHEKPPRSPHKAGGWALGDARFKQQIAKALGRRVVPLPKGRPRVATQRGIN